MGERGYDDDGYDDEAVAVEDAGDAADASSRRDGDANVVSLFRGRSPAHDADQADTDQADTDQADTDAADHDAADHAGEAAGEGDPGADTSTGPRPDVGGIFERLRSEVPTVDNALAEAPDTDQSGGDDEAPPPEPTPFTRRDEALVPLILAGARKLKRVLADEQNGVLDTLRRNEPVTSVDALLPPLDEHLRRYVDGLAEDLVAAAATGATEVGLNDTKTLRRKLANAGALDGAHALLASDLVGPLRDRLGRSIAEGDGDNDEITKRIRAVYREWKTQHIDDQLDDVFRFAHGGGIATIVEPGRPMTWTIDPQQPACPDCEDNSLAGTVAAGEAYPTGHTSAPGHPGCRCMTVPASG